MSIAVVYQFALLPIAWDSSPGQSTQVWTALSGGLMAICCVACRVDRFHSRTLTVQLGSFIVLYVLFAAISYYVVGSQTQERWNILSEAVTLLVLAFIYYGFGVAVASRNVRLAIFIAVAITAVHTISSRELLTDDQLWLRSQAGLRTAYQYTGDSFAIICLLLLGLTRGAALRVALMIVGTIVLFIIPSRSSALLGVTAILSWSLLFAGRRTFFLLAAAAGLFAWYFELFSVANLEDMFLGTRFENLVTGAVDTSKAGRDSVARTGFEIIREYFFFGNWGFQLQRFGDAGMYVHNAMDIWAQTGIVPFAAFVIMWVSILWRTTNASLAKLPLEGFLGVIVFALLSWMFTRHTHVSLMYFCLGIISANLAGTVGRPRTRKRSRRRRSRHRRAAFPSAGLPSDEAIPAGSGPKVTQ